MAKKLISFDDTKPGTGLPDVVEQRFDGQTANLIQQPDTLTRTALDEIVDKTPYTLTTYEHMADAFKKVLYQENRNTLYATTQRATGEIWKTTTGGDSWSQVGTLGYEPHTLNKVEGTGTLIAVEKTRHDQPNMNVRVSRSTDDGATWTQVTTMNFPGLGPDTILSPESGVVLLAEYGNIGQTVYRILRSADDGVTWTTVFSSSGTAHVLDPGHIHSVVRDPVTNTLIAFVDYSQPEIWGSNDHGVTWELIGTSSKTRHPNWVRPMFFQDHIAWGNDNEAEGRVYRIPRVDFYAGNFDASEEVAKLGNQRFYSHMEILPGVWLMAGATEFVNRERPASYNPRLYIVSDEATQIVGGAEMVVPLPNLQGSSTGNRFDLPAGPHTPADREGHTWVNLPTQSNPNHWAMVPITVGLDVPTPRLSSGFAHSPIIPNNTPIRARTGDGSTTTAILLMDTRGVVRLSATGQRFEMDPVSGQYGFYFGTELSASLKKGQFRLHGSSLSLRDSGPSIYTGNNPPENVQTGFPGAVFVQGGDDPSVWQRTSGATSGSSVDGWRRLMPAPEIAPEEALLSATHTVNTQGKFHGRLAVEFRTNRLLIAQGSLPTSPWGDVAGEVVHTPV